MTAPLADTPPLLAARAVTKRFGAFTALDSVDFAVHAGEIHALLGENGAGKSTLMNVLSGLLRPTSGDILLHGAPVRFASPREAERAGVGMVHQHFLLVPPLSVAENLLLGASPDKGGPLSYPVESVLQEAQALSDRLNWTIPWQAKAGDLPVGTQQRVEILKALRGNTRVLIFDEPTAVLSPTETPELFQTLRALAGEGRGLVFISHKLDEVLALAQTVTVLRRGRVVFRTVAASATAASLAEAMVGITPPPVPLPEAERGSSSMQPVTASGAGWYVLKGSPDSGDSLLSELPLSASGRGTGGGVIAPSLHLQNLTLLPPGKRNATTATARPLLDNLTFSVAAGEIFGIAGVDGNGQTELAACLSGLLRPTSGTITVQGERRVLTRLRFGGRGLPLFPPTAIGKVSRSR